MFTGIIQGVATVGAIEDRPGLRAFDLAFPAGFGDGLVVGASVSVDGVCLTATRVASRDRARFDIMEKSLDLTTLGRCVEGARVNVERAACVGTEIGGHPLSGHVDFQAPVLAVRQKENNHVLRIGVPSAYRPYVFTRGYIAVNGASLTVARVDRRAGWFEVWLIPETRRATVFEEKAVGDRLNVEIDRGTQIMVDTVRDTVRDYLARRRPGSTARATRDA